MPAVVPSPGLGPLIVIPSVLVPEIVVAPAATASRVTVPLVLLVLSVLFARSTDRVPAPVFTEVPGAMVMSAAPGPRRLSMTPSATESFATSDRFPPPVSMLASSTMLRPASRVRLPALPVGGATMGLVIVMSSFACNVTSVPASRAFVIKPGGIVMVWPWSTA